MAVIPTILNLFAKQNSTATFINLKIKDGNIKSFEDILKTEYTNFAELRSDVGWLGHYLRVQHVKDVPRQLRKSVELAACYIAKIKEKFGNFNLAKELTPLTPHSLKMYTEGIQNNGTRKS